MKATVFLVGFLAVSYGVFIAFASGWVLQAAGWILVGVAMLLAGGAASESRQRGQLENPVRVVRRALSDVRAKVQAWDQRS